MANLRVDKITGTETFETTGSVQFDGNADYLNIPDSDDLDFGSEDFTIECWILPIGDNNGGTNFSIFYNKGIDLQCYWRDNLNRIEVYADSNGGSDYDILNSLSTPTDSVNRGVWTHVAIVRSGDTFQIYLDGKASGPPKTSSSAIGANSFDATIGDYKPDLTKYEFNGHISNVRVLKGVALYTKNFKIPMRELEVIPGTVLLACQSKTDATLEKTGKTITVNGNAVANELTPGLLTPIVKSGGGSAITGSVEFNGVNDYLDIPNSSDLRLNTTSEDFTIECWINPASSGTAYIVGFYNFDDTRRSWQLYLSNTQPRFIYSADGSNTTTIIGTHIGENEWAHVAIVKNSSTVSLYQNGIKRAENPSTTFHTVTEDPLRIGADWLSPPTRHLKSFVSNLRIVKGTALYTHDFIPPTRELKKIPGTVLLCCQDPDDITKEATGKTITGYGRYQTTDGIELLTNPTFDGDLSGWTVAQGTISYNSTQGTANMTGTSGNSLNQTITTIVGRTYILQAEVTDTGNTPNNVGIVFRPSTDSSGGLFPGLTYVSSNSVLSRTKLFSYVYTATTTSTVVKLWGGTNVTGNWSRASVKLLQGSTKGSKFTPQVGDDRKVTFEGVTKINTENYFYFPTGDTITRETRSGRGVSAGGLGSPANFNIIDYVNISSMGNAFDFGDLTYIARAVTGLGNQTRGVMAGGANPVILDNINYITIATTGNASNFGDLTDERRGAGACASNTRGIIAGGRDNASPSNKLNTVDYINIATTGNALSFGELNFKSVLQSGVSSPTRGVFAGGYTPTPITSIDFITIATTGNGHDFGDLTTARYGLGGVASSVRGVFAGGNIPGGYTDVMDYITIASFGNVQDYGDLFVAQGLSSGASNGSRGIFSGGNNPGRTNTIQYVTITSTGNAKDFGDLTVAREQLAGLSDSHGGLG